MLKNEIRSSHCKYQGCFGVPAFGPSRLVLHTSAAKSKLILAWQKPWEPAARFKRPREHLTECRSSLPFVSRGSKSIENHCIFWHYWPKLEKIIECLNIFHLFVQMELTQWVQNARLRTSKVWKSIEIFRLLLKKVAICTRGVHILIIDVMVQVLSFSFFLHTSAAKWQQIRSMRFYRNHAFTKAQQKLMILTTHVMKHRKNQYKSNNYQLLWPPSQGTFPNSLEILLHDFGAPVAPLLL